MMEVINSISRISARIEALLKEIDRALEELTDCPECYGGLIPKVQHVKRIVEGVKSDIASQRNLEVEKEVRKKDARARINITTYWLGLNTYINDYSKSPQRHFTRNWFFRGSQDSDLFHELTHLHGTERDDVLPFNEWNDSLRIDSLMGTAFAEWSIYNYEKREADRRRSNRECCCTKSSVLGGGSLAPTEVGGPPPAVELMQ